MIDKNKNSYKQNFKSKKHISYHLYIIHSKRMLYTNKATLKNLFLSQYNYHLRLKAFFILFVSYFIYNALTKIKLQNTI